MRFEEQSHKERAQLVLRRLNELEYKFKEGEDGTEKDWNFFIKGFESGMTFEKEHCSYQRRTDFLKMESQLYQDRASEAMMTLQHIFAAENSKEYLDDKDYLRRYLHLKSRLMEIISILRG